MSSHHQTGKHASKIATVSTKFEFVQNDFKKVVIQEIPLSLGVDKIGQKFELD